MPHRPEIFISATTKDLKTCRQSVRDALLTLGCVPVTQDHFAPDSRTVREMLRAKIAVCDAVIHLAGDCYGYEPQEREPGEPRRSYTQMEYDIARELGKPVYTFVCADGFPFDAHQPESDDLHELQRQHRAALSAGDRVYVPVRHPADLEKSVRELQTRVEALGRDLGRTRSWLGRGVAMAVVVLLIVGGVLLLLHRRAAVIQEQNSVLQQQNQAQAQQIGAMQAQLQQQTRTTEQVLAAVQRLGPTGDPGKSDSIALAHAQVAKERGISVEELQKQLADENTDVKALLTRIDAQSAAAQAQTDQWEKLKRNALTKLGDSENAAGRYAAAVEPYQQAFALHDENKEPLLWCDAAQQLEVALEHMGRYAEAESLARKLVERRTVLQGAEHPNTLQSVNILAIVLDAKGDYAGAEPLYRRALEAYERTLGREHPDTLRSVNNLAVMLYVKGDYAGAEPLYRRALEAYERTLGKEYPDTLSSVNNLAVMLAAKRDYMGAEPLYRRCLEARERTLGKEHPDSLSSVNNLANLLAVKHDYQEAESLLRRCLEARERTIGRKHPDTATTAFNLSQVEMRQGKLSEALPLAEEAVAAAKACLPENHPSRRMYEQHLTTLLAKIGATTKSGT